MKKKVTASNRYKPLIIMTVLEPTGIWFAGGKPIDTRVNHKRQTMASGRHFKTMKNCRSYLRFLASEHPYIKHVQVDVFRYKHKVRRLSIRSFTLVEG